MKPEIPKILHVLRSPRAEGTVKLVLDLMQTGQAEHELLILESEPADLLEELCASAAWSRIERRLPSGPWKFPWIVAKAWDTCRKRKPDVVICWPNGFSAFVLLGAACAGVRNLISHAGNPPTPTFWGRAHTVMTTGMIWALGGRMVCCSAYVAAQFRRNAGIFASILRVVYNCAPLEEIRAMAAAARAVRTDRDPRLIMVATLEAHKDHATLLRAMPELLLSAPGAQLWLVGDGSMRRGLEELTAALGLEPAVRFLGSRRDVPDLLGQSDVFVFSTTAQEGLGTVLIEAMAAGLAIVASDVPACKEVLGDGRWGRLVPAGDSDSLARSLVQSVRNPAEADSDARREALNRYQPARMMAGYLAAAG